jgi:hypothetical protein
VDALPIVIRESKILTGNDLGLLGNVASLPEEVTTFVNASEEIHKLAQQELKKGNVSEAWKLLISE